jgi:cyclopropane fatty-acyl-phospholipid synthase-like methyltransferase
MKSVPPDVPSPIDLQDEADARAWTESANTLRPSRKTFFAAISSAIRESQPVTVLELGSGPGFLAKQVLDDHPTIRMTLLDFSEPMHRLAGERLRQHASRVTHVCRSFKDEDWLDSLGPFDYVVTIQAVHELRHKRYATNLHRQVRSLLRQGGAYLVSDHHAGENGMKNTELYMTVDEQREALRTAGFATVRELLLLNGLVLHSAA